MTQTGGGVGVVQGLGVSGYQPEHGLELSALGGVCTAPQHTAHVGDSAVVDTEVLHGEDGVVPEVPEALFLPGRGVSGMGHDL